METQVPEEELTFKAIEEARKKVLKALVSSIDEESVKQLRKIFKSDVKGFIRKYLYEDFQSAEELIVQLILTDKWYRDELRRNSGLELKVLTQEKQMNNLKLKAKEAETDELIRSIRESGREVTVSFTLPAVEITEDPNKESAAVSLYRK